ncbi:hypothetical protein CI102_11750 [Trichoderma harzianum]|nr:hypothetical protein CI102_11750 [Trichoderma harzianum]
MHIGLYRQAAMKQVKPCYSGLYPPPLCDQKAASAVLAWLFVCLFAYLHFVDATSVHPQALQRITASSGAHQKGTKRTPACVITAAIRPRASHSRQRPLLRLCR